jgi:hypothetical protein
MLVLKKLVDFSPLLYRYNVSLFLLRNFVALGMNQGRQDDRSSAAPTHISSAEHRLKGGPSPASLCKRDERFLEWVLRSWSRGNHPSQLISQFSCWGLHGHQKSNIHQDLSFPPLARHHCLDIVFSPDQKVTDIEFLLHRGFMLNDQKRDDRPR